MQSAALTIALPACDICLLLNSCCVKYRSVQEQKPLYYHKMNTGSCLQKNYTFIALIYTHSNSFTKGMILNDLWALQWVAVFVAAAVWQTRV